METNFSRKTILLLREMYADPANEIICSIEVPRGKQNIGDVICKAIMEHYGSDEVHIKTNDNKPMRDGWEGVEIEVERLDSGDWNADEYSLTRLVQYKAK
jgi:hypothetical protein